MTVKKLLTRNFKTFCTLTRAYSLPISVMSWLIPFVYAVFNNGNIVYGILALAGIILLHLATNLFDDIVDYSRELIDIKNNKKDYFNFQKGKCACIIENKVTLKQAFMINLALFFVVLFIGMFFFSIFGTKLLAIIIPSALLCLLYPILGCLGFGEFIIAIIFSPLIYLGVYFVMTSSFSYQILILSISTGLLSVAILFNQSLLDYKYDTTNRKITLCRLCANEKNALIMLSVIISLAFINLIYFIANNTLSIIYLLPLITLPLAVKLIKEMNDYIKKGKVPDNSKIFIEKFLLAQNLQKYFIITLCISVILSYWFKI